MRNFFEVATAMSVKNGAASPPLYQRIRGDIEMKIMSGELQPGDRIPFEHELMTEYGCSRMTVNKALSGLASAGLISRQRRLGSFVAQPRIHMAALQILDVREEIEKRGFAYDLRLLSRQVLGPDSEEGNAMRIPRNGSLLEIDCLHLADGRPYALEHRLINLSSVPSAIDADFEQTPPGTWLLAHVPWTEAEHRICATAAGNDAAVLDLDAGAPCLVLERRTWRDRESITYVRNIYNADNFDMTARFLSQTDSLDPAESRM